MQQEGYLAHGIEQVGSEARYDEQVKRLLANKLILATIMQGCVEEYRGCTVTEIAGYIENEPEIGSVGVHADDTNRDIDGTIRGASTEDVTATEGVVRYDIRFYAKAPGEDGLISLIINVEAQNRYDPGYPLLKRALYYCSRMISAQYGTEFTKSEYGNIKKVYSIWVCTQPPKEYRNTITQYSIQEKQLVGHAEESVKNYDLMSAVMIRLGDENDANYSGLLKFLEVLLSAEKTAAEKKSILQTEFDLPLTQEIESEVQTMCNVSQGVLEKGIIQGRSLGRDERTLELIRNLMASTKQSAEQVMALLRISADEQEKYKALLQS